MRIKNLTRQQKMIVLVNRKVKYQEKARKPIKVKKVLRVKKAMNQLNQK